MPSPTDTGSKALQTLRGLTEAVRQASGGDRVPRNRDDLLRMVHELELHEIAFEEQNQELREAQHELEESRQEFSELYELAPVGYLTIDRNMVIAQANLTMAAMLGIERGRLVGRSFLLFVQHPSRDALYMARGAGTRWSGDLVLRKADGGELPVSMVSAPADVRFWRCAVIDTTAHHVAEQRLRASEERYRGLAEQLVDGIFVTDAEGRYLDANRAGCDMLGYSLDEIKRRTIRDVLPRSELPKLPEQFRRLATRDVVRNVWCFRRKDGSTFDGELVARRLPDGRLQGVVRDLTGQKRSAHALLRRLEFERFLFELSRTFISLPEAEVSVNMERGLAQVGEFLNMDRVTILELSRDRPEITVAYSWNAPGVSGPPPAIAKSAWPWWVNQVLNGNVSLASHLDDLPEEAAAEKEYLHQRGVASVASIPLQAGGEITGAISFVTVHDHVTWTEELVNQLRAIGDILWNALKRRQAVQALLAAQVVVRESEERFRLAMNNVAEGVCILDLDGVITYANPAAEAMFGWTSAELVGRKMHDVTHYKHPDGTPYPGIECSSIQILQAGIELRDHEDTFIRKDGRFFPLVVSASPLKKDGVTVGTVVGIRDETLRRNAERAVRDSEALRASEERYRGLAEQVVDGIVVTSGKGQVLDANRAACDMFGYTLDEVKGLSTKEGIAAEDLPKLQATLERFATEPILRDEWQLKRKDGSVFTGEVVGRQLPDGRVQAVVRDITERKQAEELQRRLHEIAMLPLNKATVEEMLGAIVETAIAIADADFGNIQLMDHESSTLRIVAQRGFPPWWIDYWRSVPRGHGTCGTALKRAGRVIVEDVERSPIFSGRDLEVQRQAGVRAVMSTPLVSRSGELVGMLSTHFRKPWRPDERKLPILDLLAREAADIIQHEQAEAEIGRQAALLDLAHDNIFVMDREGRIRYWNAGAARCYGWSKEEALGKVSLDLLQTRFPEPRERILDMVLRSGHWEGELIHATRTGQCIIVDSRWALQPGANAKDFRILEINYDITRRKKLEQEREDDARRKDEFLAFLGHELRNPLAAIHTAGQVLSGSTSPGLRARMEDTIARQTALMRRLVDDLLEHERITRGHIELKRERVDLAESLQRAVAAVQSNVAARNQTLRLRLPSQPVPFMADVARLDQILGNLLTNATKYTGLGGSIELSGAREERDVVIRCKDNGQGVPREYQQKIFEPFARGPKTSLGYGEASVGLGLALVKQLAELHGGTVGVESAGTGLGSEFSVRLPFMAPADLATPEKPAVARAARRARSVVIVEDNPSVGATLKAALEQAGHSVHLFEDGSSMLAGLSDLKPDALVIDVGLPGMDGYELAAKLKQQTNTRDALRIAVSGFKRRKHASAAAFDHYFNKPVDVPELLTLLDSGR